MLTEKIQREAARRFVGAAAEDIFHCIGAKALEQTASACLHCRGCEARCPFEVKTADRMRQAAALFGC